MVHCGRVVDLATFEAQELGDGLSAEDQVIGQKVVFQFTLQAYSAH